MRLRIPSRPLLGSGSVALSMLLHALLVGSGIYATDVSARKLEEMVSERVTYRPPPDRRPNMEASVEHLQFVDIGAGLRVADGGTVTNAPATEKFEGARSSAGNTGDGAKAAPTSQQVVSQDSVYSVLEVEERAARVEGSAAPKYPADLLQQRIEGSAFVRFVVDTNGHADPASVHVISFTNELFAESVRSAVPQMIFSPATVSGIRVRQAVEQNFRFKLPALDPAPAAAKPS